MGQAYFSAASEHYNAQMQALFTAYATAVKKLVDDDSGGENFPWFELHDIDSFPGFAAPPTALAPRSGLRRVGTVRLKGAVDKNGASDDGLSAPEVNLLHRKLQNLREITFSHTGPRIRTGRNCPCHPSRTDLHR